MNTLEKLYALIERQAKLEEIEAAYINHIQHITNNNKSKTARILGIDRRTMYRKTQPVRQYSPGDKVHLISGESGEIIVLDNKSKHHYIVRLSNGAIGSYHGELISNE